jgi:hypothetical protein
VISVGKWQLAICSRQFAKSNWQKVIILFGKINNVGGEQNLQLSTFNLELKHGRNTNARWQYVARIN